MSLNIKHAILYGRRRYQNENGGESPHERTARPPEEIAVTQHAGALVVIIGHLGY